MVFIRALSLLAFLFVCHGIPDGILAQNSQSGQHTDLTRKNSVVEVSRKEIEIGRYWHASRILRDFQQDQAVLDSELTLLLAEADAGWANWAGVVDGLQG